MYCLDVRLVQVYDYVDNHVPMRSRMCERPLNGYVPIEYAIECERAPRPQESRTNLGCQ
jgi:hypothetical protein